MFTWEITFGTASGRIKMLYSKTQFISRYDAEKDLNQNIDTINKILASCGCIVIYNIAIVFKSSH